MSSIESKPSPLFMMSSSPAWEYLVDAGQRSVLFWDVMRQRGKQYREHLRETSAACAPLRSGAGGRRPHAASGRSTMASCASSPPEDVEIDPTRRPFVVVDPRAGHGPGIGGFKADSEIGVALKAGHPCYFIGFLPEPMPGQTIEDIMRAEAVFLEKVIALHPEADGKPCVIGNCQAGWAVMMLAATGRSCSVRSSSPVRRCPIGPACAARIRCATAAACWAAAGSRRSRATSVHGKFDGAWLVQNFENLNPANTLWTKQYNLYSKVDTEAPRYLDFERWWGGHVTLNAEEMQSIVDELFIGNKLAAGEIQSVRRHHHRSAQHPLADRRVLFEGRQHHAAAAGAGVDSRPLRRRRRNSHARPDDRLHACTRRSAIWGSSFPAAWPERSTTNSRATSISSTCCRPASTRRSSSRKPRIRSVPICSPASG